MALLLVEALRGKKLPQVLYFVYSHDSHAVCTHIRLQKKVLKKSELQVVEQTIMASGLLLLISLGAVLVVRDTLNLGHGLF